MHCGACLHDVIGRNGKLLFYGPNSKERRSCPFEEMNQYLYLVRNRIYLTLIIRYYILISLYDPLYKRDVRQRYQYKLFQGRDLVLLGVPQMP